MKKFTLLILFLTLFSLGSYAQFGCGSGVVITNGYSQNNITTPGNGGIEDWNTDPIDAAISYQYWNDDVYLFQYTAGAFDENITMTTYSRKAWNGIGIFSQCNGSTFSMPLNGTDGSKGTSAANSTKTITATIASGTTVYIATGQYGAPNNLDFDVVSFSVVPIINVPNCDAALTTPANGTTTAPLNGQITWTAATGSPSGYKLNVGTTTGGTNILNAVEVGNVLTYNIGSLIPGTTYYVSIVATNSNGSATGCTEFSFTACSPNTEFFEDFDSALTGATNPMPDCWGKAGNGATYITVGSLAPNTPANRLYMAANGTATTPTHGFAITPSISNLQAGTHRFKFKVYCLTANKSLDIGYFTDMSDTSTFVNLETIVMPGTAQTTAEEFSIEPTGVPAGVSNLVFRNNAIDGSTTIYIDDVAWEPLPVCTDITIIEAQTFNSTSATILWEQVSSELGYEYVYAVSTTTNPYTLTPISAGSNQMALLTGLTPNTTYKIWIRSVCEAGVFGNWPNNAFTFTTACLPATEFSENFDSYTLIGATNPLPDCWTRFGNTGTSRINAGSNTPLTPPNRLYLAGFGGATSSTIGVAVMPPVSNLQAETHRLKFKAYCTTASKLLELGYYEFAADASSFVELEAFEMPSIALTSATEFIYTPTNVPAGIESLVFRVNGGTTAVNTIVYIDDVVWQPLPTCTSITAIEIANVTSTTVDASWSIGDAETAWQYVYDVSTNTDPTTLTPTTVNGTPSLTLTGLTPTTSYNLWIRSDCGDGLLGNWSVVQTFTTTCALKTSFFENFDSGETGAGSPMPDCWSRAGNGSTYLKDGAAAPGSAPNRLYMFANGSLSTPTKSYAIMPIVSNLADGTHRLRFKAFASSANKKVQVGYFSDVTDLNTFIVLETFNLPSSAPSTAVTFTYIPTDIPAGITALAFKNTGLPAATTLYIDDVIWEAIPLCPDVTVVSFQNSTPNTATISWTPGASETAWQYVYGLADETNPNTLTPVIDVLENPQTTISGLLANTNYKFWVRSVCGTNLGVFSPVLAFSTKCDLLTSFSENFDTSEAGTSSPMPACWSRAAIGNTYVKSGGGAPGSAPNHLYMYNYGPLPTLSLAIMPAVSNLQAATHRLQFSAYATAPDRYLEIGYLVDASDLNTFSLLETIELPGSIASAAQTFTFQPEALPEGVTSLVFRNPATPTLATTLYIDNVVWEAIPTTVPTCATNVIGAPDANCGNYASTISWDFNASADGTYLTIGTTTGGVDILNNQDLGEALTYSFIGDVSTTYFYTVTPYNSAGLASGCVEQSFVTLATGCYCISAPTSNNGLGVTNVQLGTESFLNGDVTYFDHTATVVDLQQGVVSNLKITLATSYTYNTNVWIDLNDNYTFEADELFFQGEALGINPTIQNASFFMPETATLGQHRMRIVTTDGLQTPANPCYNGIFGVTLDFSVNLTAAPTCLAPSDLGFDIETITANEATVNWIAPTTAVANGYEYFITTNLTTVPSESTTPTGTVAAGITSVALTNLSIGTVYKFYVRSLCSNSDTSDWSQPGMFSTACATMTLPYLIDFDAAVVPNLPLCTTNENVGTGNNWVTANATGSSFTGKVLKYNFSNSNAANTWFFTNEVNLVAGQEYSISYKYGTNSTGTYTEKLKVAYGFSATAADMVNQLANHPSVSGTTAQTNTVSFIAAVTGTYVFGFNAYSNANQDVLFLDNILIETVLGTTDFNSDTFTAYPNPVKNNLNIRYTENIIDVTVFNLLGQQLFVKNINANQGQIDMSSLTSGTYLVKVKSGDKVKTLKVIKE